MFDGINGAVAAHAKGSKRWKKAIPAQVRKLRIGALEPILGTPEKPKTPDWWDGKVRKRKPSRPCPNPEWKKPAKKPSNQSKLSPRFDAAITAIGSMGTQHQFFLTVVTTIQFSHEDAIAAALHDVTQLDQLIRRRIPGAMYILTPEVDLYMVRDLDAGLLPDATWRNGLDPSMICYKVHIHAPVFAPGHTAASLEKVFTTTATGKRSRLYSGANQVRVIDTHIIEVNGQQVSDIRGCVGYSRKSHYRPPVDKRMMEGAPEWFLVADEIASNPKMIKIGGLRKARRKSGFSRKTQATIIDPTTATLMTVDEYRVHDNAMLGTGRSGDDGVTAGATDRNLSSNTCINSSDLSIWKRAGKEIRKKFGWFVQGVIDRVLTVVGWGGFRSGNGQVGPP